MPRALVTCVILCLLALPAPAQRSLAGEEQMRLMLEELNNVGSVMMIAAHPDDENTALLAYLARGRHVRTAYLSLTRGEGGQNLIGSEQSDELGIIRTEELLAARRIDGAEQYFTRAIDFGFTKTAAETLMKWPREKVLADVVWDIRRFRPDVIILRFTGTPRDGHGQHQASAILGKEAFSAAADPKRFPEQLKYVKAWQAKRLMTNLASFNAEQQKEIAKIPDKLELDLGAYDPELGYSYNEIAGMSRSQHRSQSMGTAERKGELLNYLVTNEGDKARKDIFEDIDLRWTRLAGGAPVGTLIQQAQSAFVPAHPEALVPVLNKIRPLVVALAASDPVAQRKLIQLDETIALAAGLAVEAQAEKFEVTPGQTVKLTLTSLVRNPIAATISHITLKGMLDLPAVAVPQPEMMHNKPDAVAATVKIPETQAYTQPYWLELPKDGSMYTVRDQLEVGDPESPPVMTAEFRFNISGTEIVLVRPVEHRYVDRIYGERVRPFVVVPPVSVDFGGTALVFPNGQSRRIEVPVKTNSGKTSGEVRLATPAGWRVDPPMQRFELTGVDEQSTATFNLTPPTADSKGELRAVAKVGEREVSTNTRVIDYPHIPPQTLLPPAESVLVRTEVKILAHNIGYVVGAGDEVPGALRQLGCEVTFLSPEDLAHGDLSRYDAIVTGVRAFNTRPDLRANYQRLFAFAENGGTLIVQYNTPDGGPPGAPVPETSTLAHIGPYPIKTGRERVTVEEAPVTFPNPNIVLLHRPNEITERDFDGWVQERGLNFPTEWDKRYQSVLESHDPGEKPLLGGELYTRYGKGAYISTSYDWFRELPAGVPGAYRLFANMLSAAKVQ